MIRIIGMSFLGFFALWFALTMFAYDFYTRIGAVIIVFWVWLAFREGLL